MPKYNEYLVEDISSSITNMKVLKIYGNLEFNESDIIRKVSNALRDFLNKNKNVDYLIAYYFPSHEDMDNNASLCFIILNEDIKTIDLSDFEETSKKLRWNEDYGFFSAVVKDKTSSDYQLVKEADAMLQIVEDAYFILYDLEITDSFRNFSGHDVFYNYLEKWMIKAEHINKGHGELELIVKNDFMSLVRHMGNILYCCLSDIGRGIKEDRKKQWIFNHELANARDKFEVVRHQLKYLMREYLK